MSDGKLKFVITIDDKGTPIIKSMDGSIKRIEKTSVAATKKMSKGFGSMWKQMAGGQLIFAGIHKAIRTLSAGFASVKNDLLSFDTEFQNVTTLLNNGEEVTYAMKNEILKLAGALGSSTELTKGLYQALSASIEPAKAVKFVGEAAKFAKAGLTDMTSSVDVLTTILKSYGMAAEKVTYVSDVLFQTIKDGKVTGQQLAQSLGNVIPIAASMGIGIEQVSAAIATLTKVGVSSDIAVTSLKQTMMSILKPTEQAQAAAKRFGIELSKAAMEKAGGFQKYLMLLKEKLKGNSKAMTEMFPNIRALTAVFSLAGTQAEAFASEMEKMKDVSNNTTLAFDKQMKGYKAMTDAIKNELSAAFQKNLIPVLEKVKDFIVENKDAIMEFGKKAIDAIMAFGRTVAKVLEILYKFRKELELIKKTITGATVGKTIFDEIDILTSHSKQTAESVEQIRSFGKELGITSGNLRKNALAIYNNEKAYKHLNPAAKKIVDEFAKQNGVYIKSIEITKKVNRETKETIKTKKELKKHIEYMDVAFLSQIDQLKLLNISLKMNGINLEGLSINLQDVTKKTEDFELSMLSEIDKLNIASGAAQMMGLSLLGINIPMIDLGKETKVTAWESMNLADKMQVVASAASALRGLLEELGIETGGTADGFVDLASGAATFAAAFAAKDIAGMIAGVTQALTGLLKIFASHGIEKAIERENRWMKMNDDLKESLKKLAKEVGNTHTATSMMLVDIMEQSDITVDNFSKWANRVKEIFIDLDNHYISESEFMTTMGESWTKLVGEAQRLGTEGSTKMLEIIREMENRGMKIAEISEYRIAQLKGTAQALQDYALAGGKNVKEYSGVLLASLQAEGVSLSEIVDIMGSNLPAGLRKFVDENKNALDTISATKKMLEGLGNSAYLSQEIFNKLQGDIIRAYDSMTEGGKNQEQALRAVAPALAKELWYAEQYNYTLDDKTKKMIADAKAAGINIDNMKSQDQLNKEMADNMQKLVDIMGDFVKGIRAGTDALEDFGVAGKNIHFDPGDIPDYRSGKGGIPAFAEGGHFWVDKPTPIIVGENYRPEEVIIKPEGKSGSDMAVNVEKIEFSMSFPNVTNVEPISALKKGLIMNDQGIRTDFEKLIKKRSN